LEGAEGGFSELTLEYSMRALATRKWPGGVALLGAVLAGAVWWSPASQQPAAKDPPKDDTLFTSKIRPTLEGTCFKCHGGEKVRGGLKVDSRAALLKGGESGPAIIPGDADKSLLIQALRYTHDEIKMPPGKPLPPGVVDDFAAWVRDGANWPEKAAPFVLARNDKRWAFEPVKSTDPPADTSGWSVNPVDRFVRAKHRDSGLEPTAVADRRTLIRRATFDLIGLPPKPEDVDAFVNDEAPDAFARLVERLLASPHYGERWGRHWLDVVRYADTGGFEADFFYPNAWRYRDYVIRSLNAGKPIARFIHEQVAGDELWPGDPDAVVATALFCVGPALSESAMINNQLEYEWLTDAADTVGAAFLGLTMGCARCHDHKYDPITQKDYFGLQAVFAASDRPFPAKIRQSRLKFLNNILSETPLPKELEGDPRCTVETEDKVGFHLFHRARPLTVHRLHRGELARPAEVMDPAFPAALVQAKNAPGFSGVPVEKRRAALARWLTSADNPLTARVLVNRVWGWHFGQALVRTPNDFGAQGEAPSHPELLDWLAQDFVDHGWDLKHLHRRIMLSATYQMESVAKGRGLEIDPRNRLLWHFPRHRLDGEIIRDTLLACGGNINLKLGGPPIVPPLSSQELAGVFDAKGKWPVTKDAAEHTRRSVYLINRRTFVYPLLAGFDPPETMVSCPQRPRTIVPAQALTLLNSPLAWQQAQAFGRRLQQDSGDDVGRQTARGWQIAFGRDITPQERERALTFLQKRTQAANRETALAELCLVMFNANEFIYID
jgi:hypothetical protein